MSKIIVAQSNDNAIPVFQKAIDEHDFYTKLYLKFPSAPSSENVISLQDANAHLAINPVQNTEYNDMLYPDLTDDDVKSGLFLSVVRQLCSGPPILF